MLREYQVALIPFREYFIYSITNANGINTEVAPGNGASGLLTN
jgi:hypothetical protein